MKYECLEQKCGKVFLHPAKQSFTRSELGVVSAEEYYVCPYCLSKNIDKISSPALRIESIQSVKIADADEWIKKGYEVKESYASTVTLVKYGAIEKKPEEAKPTLQESQAAIDKDSEQLRKDLKQLSSE
jgi:DNA-directed RNA polymerase subunit RPC12/RpoP